MDGFKFCGYIIHFCGIPVVWKSKSMKSVVLSTTEAEYVVVSEVVKEIKFLYQMLSSMETKVPLPIKVQVDNVGAIWLANDTIPTRNGRELGEIWVSKVGTNF